MLKKLLSFALACSMFSMLPLSSFADDIVENIPVDPSDLVIESLDPYDYGGVYVENGQTFISSTETKDLSQELSLALAKHTDADLLVSENTVKYSYGELLDAQDKIVQSMENSNPYEIYETCINQKENTVGVGSPNWTEDKKSKISELTGLSLEHLSFYITTPEDIDKEFFSPDVAEIFNENIEEKASTLTPKPGSEIVCDGASMSICVPIVWELGSSSKGGFLTCAHTKDKTDKPVYDKNGNLIAYGRLWDYGGYFDSCLLERSSNNVKGTFTLPDNQKIQSSRTPKTGDIIYRYGQHHSTPVSGEVLATDVKVKHTGTNVVVVGFKTNAPTVGGDSGGPIMTNSSSGKYALVGLNSTTNYGVPINKVLDKYHVKLSNAFPTK